MDEEKKMPKFDIIPYHRPLISHFRPPRWISHYIIDTATPPSSALNVMKLEPVRFAVDLDIRQNIFNIHAAVAEEKMKQKIMNFSSLICAAHTLDVIEKLSLIIIS